MARIACYTIFLNEADHVARWADTTQAADVRFVLDTGSTDGTQDLLTDHGIAWRPALIDPFRFDDARNTALAMIGDVDYCLQIDADETLNDNWRDGVDRDRHRPGRYTYRWVNCGNATWGVVHRSNLHARHGFRWNHPCHECLEPLCETRFLTDLVVEHHPDETKPRHHYLDLLERGHRQRPGDHRMAFYYARELLHVGRLGEARQQLWEFVHMPGGWPPETAEGWRLLASIDDDPQRWLWHAIAQCPERREPYVDLARLHLAHNDRAAARAALTLAARCVDESIYTTQRDAWGDAFDRLVAEVNA